MKRRKPTKRNTCIPCNPGLRRIRRRNPNEDYYKNALRQILKEINLVKDEDDYKGAMKAIFMIEKITRSSLDLSWD